MHPSSTPAAPLPEQNKQPYKKVPAVELADAEAKAQPGKAVQPPSSLKTKS